MAFAIIDSGWIVGYGFTNNQYEFAFLAVPITGPLPLGVTTTSLLPRKVGTAYSQTFAATGGQAPYHWTNISGTLPKGLTLATNGVISGTPTTNGTFNFTVKVTDTLSVMATQALAISILETNKPTLKDHESHGRTND